MQQATFFYRAVVYEIKDKTIWLLTVSKLV